ncbi:MAG: hypothetical protein C4516_00370 [Oxalobacter sp.]|nr:MAG: hypothetical protein C4516_00370 [Oxalobacter sp.]
MINRIVRVTCLCAFLATVTSASAQGGVFSGTSQQYRDGGAHRPILLRKQGRVFAYSLPKGWQVNETSNGIDITAPDQLTGVSSSIVFGMYGNQTPEGHFRAVLSSIPLRNVQILKKTPTPSSPGPYGLRWQGIEIEFKASSNGRPIRVRAISHVLQGAGQYTAILTGVQGPVAKWDSLKLWLPQVRDSIVLTNPSVPAASMVRSMPKGTRHDDIYGRYNKSWAARGVSQDRMAKARREGTMGYTRQRDEATGQIYDVPLDAYNASRGGYVNPVRPTELLSPTND